MVQLDAIEIFYFRSIYTLKIKNLKDLCIFSGKNDCGKSNVLKALNLFFNNQTDWQAPLNFFKDFSNRRLEEVRKKTIKGKQFIRVKLHFIRGNRSVHSLPEKFYVTRTWFRNSSTPEEKSSIENDFKSEKIKTESVHRAKAGLQSYLNRIKFEYIPAVKDRSFFTYTLGLLQDTILQKKSGESRIEESVKGLNTAVEEGANQLNEEFERVCKIKTDIRLPQDLAVLFRAFSIETKSGDANMPLTMRGDGIQTRFLPSLLHYVASYSRKTYLWGFEEPENCLEHSLATELAGEIQSTYSDKSQIFLTTHSPAFTCLEENNVSTYRIYSGSEGTGVYSLCAAGVKDVDVADSLSEELGLLQLSKEQQEEFEKMKKALEGEKQILSALASKLEEAASPILLTEGKTDPLILKEAWRRLYPGQEMDFRIISCNTSNGIVDTAGADILKQALMSNRVDQPITIGLFDRDNEGIRKFDQLGKLFLADSSAPNVKVHKNRTVAAFLIPDIIGKENYVNAENLSIEFVFSDEYLTSKHDGYGLVLSQKTESTKVGNTSIKSVKTTEPHYREATNKTYFAEKVVPTFPDEAFENFKSIFDTFRSIISIL